MPTCPKCAAEVPKDADVCPKCGQPVSAAGATPRLKSKVSGLAIAALYLGIAAWLFPVTAIRLILWIPSARLFLERNHSGSDWLIAIISLGSVILCAVSIVDGWKARKQIRASGGVLRGARRAWAGLVIGSLGLFPALFLFAVAASVVAGITFVDRVPRQAIQQASAVGALRTIRTSAEAYRANYQHGYPTNLPQLGPPKAGEPASAGSADLIDRKLASGVKSEYVFLYQVTARDAAGSPTAFTVTASPVEGCGTGNGNCYFVDETGDIRFERDRLPDRHSPVLPG